MENTIILQLWEESINKIGSRPDGCSIHLDLTNRKKYIEQEYNSRNEIVPSEYEVAIGNPIVVSVSDDIYNLLKK